MSGEAVWSNYGVEPDLVDVLADPLVHLVMRRDGLGQQDVWQAVVLARARLARPARRPAGIGTAASQGAGGGVGKGSYPEVA